MSFFDKIKEAFKRKKNVTNEIAKKNEKDVFVSQKKFDIGLRKSSSALSEKINNLSKKYHSVNEKLIEEIEEALIQFDLGYASTKKILDAIVDEIKYQHVNDPKLIKEIIVDKLFVYYIQNTIIDVDLNIKDGQTNIILVTGSNGVGKTTSIAKIANLYKQNNYSVCLVAGDTFRAGAVKQLEIWANRINVPIFLPKKEGQDPASVIYQGITFAKENKIDIVICDTSGRLQNKTNLMNELKKINNVIKKIDPNQPCESLLVIDALTGQNGILQAKTFNEITKITGIILTKMDSTSKGGIILSIKDAFNLPVKFIGFGEQINDLYKFDLEKFINGLTNSINI